MASTYEALLLANMQFMLNPPIMWCNQGTTTQTISATTQTALTYTVNAYDTYNGHSTSSNTDKYFFQVPGTYLVEGLIYVASATTALTLLVGYSGTPVIGSKQTVNLSAAAGTIGTSGLVTATANSDYCSIIAYSSSGSVTTAASTGTTGAGPNQSWMRVTWLHQ